MTVKELRECLEGIDESIQVLIPHENAYVAIDNVTMSILRREYDGEFLKAVTLKFNADKREQKKKQRGMDDEANH